MSVWVEIELQNCHRSLHTSHAPRERVSWNFTAQQHGRSVVSHAPRERVSWNRACRPSCYLWCKVTLHVSVWVEIYHEQLRHSACWSRSTWACELKWSMTKAQSKLKSHAPRERVSWNASKRPLFWDQLRHAPRERVSWNRPWWHLWRPIRVTLHVSVWVEIHH